MPVLLTSRDDATNVLRVTLNRPDVRNAFDEEVIAALTGVARDAARDPTLRAIVMLDGLGIETGVSLAAVVNASAYIEPRIGHRLPSRYYRAVAR